MADEPRRSRRMSYVSLAAIEAREKAVPTADKPDTFWEEAAVDKGNDASFEKNEISDGSEDGANSDSDASEDINKDDEVDAAKRTTAEESAIRMEEESAARREKPCWYVDLATKGTGGDKSTSRYMDNADEPTKAQSNARRSEKTGGQTKTGAGLQTALNKDTKRRRHERRRNTSVAEIGKKLACSCGQNRILSTNLHNLLIQEKRLTKSRETELENKKSKAKLLKMEQKKQVPQRNSNRKGIRRSSGDSGQHLERIGDRNILRGTHEGTVVKR